MSGEADMIEGYLDGFKDTRLEIEGSNRSLAYQHGWRNGRDDRTGKPRSTYQDLRATAERLIANDTA